MSNDEAPPPDPPRPTSAELREASDRLAAEARALALRALEFRSAVQEARAIRADAAARRALEKRTPD
ncbi:MAG TPA: hypothetical protein VEA69_05530 [Tepidisphaeraceae bacterium]|nr:hypothetical protein [Tepidisphaeraceae bacterium]